ncbi:mitochondrial inner membrane protein OXA1L isoform X4 [Gallus gallus]|uniref:mitochondrial inner membrane protein OXA1L isoform X4 n=1 Tax=Gallus gallus TaxID=9031 RepID=UPI001AE935AE|nr:mitochondrial inner membrane protein OXA1L isoform X4 [Gallus gallus]
MMAAASPRLRPLLRALRAQELRAPLWARCHNGRRGLGTQATAVPPTSPTEQQSPLMGQESPLMGQEAPLVGQQSPLMGQNPLVGQEGLHLEPQLALMGRQDPVAAPPSPLVGQPHGCVGPEEVRLEDLGLGAMSPVGLVQNLLQFLHLDVGLPWWGAIAADPHLRVVLYGAATNGGRSAAGAQRGRSRVDQRPQLPRPHLRAAAAHQRHHVDGPGGGGGVGRQQPPRRGGAGGAAGAAPPLPAHDRALPGGHLRLLADVQHVQPIADAAAADPRHPLRPPHPGSAPNSPPGPHGVRPERGDPATDEEKSGRGPGVAERRETRMAAPEPPNNGGQGAAPADVRAEPVGSSRRSRSATRTETTLEGNFGLRKETIKQRPSRFEYRLLFFFR